MTKFFSFSIALLFCLNIYSQGDDCVTALTINSSTACTTPIIGTSAGATQSLPGCAGTADDDVWYKFVASGSSYSLSVTGSNSYNPVLEFFSGNCGTLSSMNCLDATGAGGTESIYLMGLSAGNTYYFRVYHYDIGSGSNTFSVCLTSNAPPINDDCVSAITVNSASVCTSGIAGSSFFGSQSMGACAGTADDDVWYKFIATMPSHSLTVTGSLGYDVVLEAFSGTCASLTSLGCNDASGGGGTEAIHLSGLTVGNTYYFRVYEYHTGWSNSTGTFSVCLTDAPTPINDDCSAAIVLPVSSSTVCSSPYNGTSLNGTQSIPSCGGGNADDDVWYKFIATANSHSITVSPSGTYDAVMELFSGACVGLVSMNCVDIAGSGGTEVIHIGGFTIGNTYYLRVYDYHTSSSSNTFTLCITTPAILPPANDECTGAFNLPVTPNCQPTNTIVTSAGATESQSPCTGSADDDIWFSFTATTNQVAINATGEPTADAVIELFSGSCSSLNSLGCMDVAYAGEKETFIKAGLTIGQVYYFRIYEFHNTGGFTFTVNIDRMELSATSSSSLICSGQIVSLTASGTPTYTWSNGITNSSPFTPTTSATYTATGIGTGSCVNTATVFINVSTPVVPEICMVTVDTANVNNEIYWDKYSYDNIDSMIVYREVLANTYQRIGAVNNTDYSRFKDTVKHIGFRNGDPNIRSYKYKLQIRDTCGNYSDTSLYHTSLFLNNDNSGNFTWNFYDIETQISPVNNYELYRDNLNNGNFTLLGTVPATLGVSSYTFTDVNFATAPPTARWAIMADGFSCTPSFKLANPNDIFTTVVKTKANVKNNFTIPNPPADPDPQGVREYNSNIKVAIMPNPASTNFSIISEVIITKINIFNNLGDLVYTTLGQQQKQLTINTSDFSNGIYSIEIITHNARGFKKVVISN